MLGAYITAIVEDDFRLQTIFRSGRALPKRKWITTNFAELTDELMHKLWTMYTISYDYAGIRFKRPSELAGEFKLLWMVDVDDDPLPDAFIVYKATPYGGKISACGTDGSDSAKRELTDKIVELLTSPGWYGEGSGKVGALMDRRRVPVVDDEALVKKLLDGKRIEWLGGGKYARSISGLGTEIKRMYGRPIIGRLSEGVEQPDPWSDHPSPLDNIM